MLVKALERERETIFDSGKREGIDERNRQIVQAMFANGFARSTIATLLALAPAEVERLHQENIHENH
jgi:DNA-directed RNA polymerase specialized sigma subunit